MDHQPALAVHASGVALEARRRSPQGLDPPASAAHRDRAGALGGYHHPTIPRGRADARGSARTAACGDPPSKPVRKPVGKQAGSLPAAAAPAAPTAATPRIVEGLFSSPSRAAAGPPPT